MIRSAILVLLTSLLLSCNVAAAPSDQAPATAAVPTAASSLPSPQPQVANAHVEHAAASGGVTSSLERLARDARGPFWVGYTVPVVGDHPYTCCWTNDWKPGPCKLEAKSQSWGSSDHERGREAGPDLVVLLRAEGGQVGRVRAVSQGCGLDAGGLRFVWLDGVEEGDSIAALERIARTASGRRGHDPGEEAVMAIALHAAPAADRTLEELAAPGPAEDVREAALFWMGQARGRRGYEVLSRVVREDPSEDIREKAIFSLSQSPIEEARGVIAEVAKSDRSPKMRGQALFWLAQTGDERAVPAILEAIERDPEVREEAVFALSQLPDGGGIEHLERLARHSADPEARSKALFWLSQEETERPEIILEAVFQDPDPDVREQAVFALSQLEGEQGTKLLVRVVREGRDPEVRKKALFWLGQSDDPAAMEALSDLLGD